MIDGWTRVCPDCGNTDSERVRRIAFHPTFQCECGYIWDGSGAKPFFFGPAEGIGEMTDEELGELAKEIVSAMERAAGELDDDARGH